MLHAAVSINVASTMSLESFALDLPTINVAFKFGDLVKDHNLMWSFDMYHTSEHYRAIVENGAVALARSMDELLALTMDALDHPERRHVAMRKTLEQKAAYCDGTSARRFRRSAFEHDRRSKSSRYCRRARASDRQRGCTGDERGATSLRQGTVTHRYRAANAVDGAKR